jgi:glycosyltransferase involved in cell wall biosynthesis
LAAFLEVFVLNHDPLVSIVIPVFNGEAYLRQAIASALAQTYPKIEVIVVNDGSTDRSAEIARSFGAIRYVEQENGGVAAALNAGIAAMRGEYFSWLSHDDLYLPTKIEAEVTALRRLQDERTIIYSRYRLIDERGNPIRVLSDAAYPTDKVDVPLFPVMRGVMHGCTVLVHRELFAKYGLFDTRLRTTQDYDLWFKMLRRTPVRFVNECLVESRVHPAQGSKTISGHDKEADDLWVDMISQVTPEEATALDGGYAAFLGAQAKFLALTPYERARKTCEDLAEAAIADTLVSIVTPFKDRIGVTADAARSALSQTHKNVEVILVDDGSSDDLAPLLRMADADNRVKILRSEGCGAGAARNTGVRAAKGRYVSFLDSDDMFMPGKIRQQLRSMEREGLAFSHTSYVTFRDGHGDEAIVHSGRFGGRVFPQIIRSCPIATPTVMMTRELALSRPFPDTSHGEDIITWISIAEEHDLGTIDEPLSRVRLAESSAAIDPVKQGIGVLSVAKYVLETYGIAHEPEVRALLCYASNLYSATRPRSGRSSAPLTAVDLFRGAGSRIRQVSDLMIAFLFHGRRFGWRSAMRKVAGWLARNA